MYYECSEDNLHDARRQISKLNFHVKGGFKASIYGLVRIVMECRKKYSIENRKLDTSSFFYFHFPLNIAN